MKYDWVQSITKREQFPPKFHGLVDAIAAKPESELTASEKRDAVKKALDVMMLFEGELLYFDKIEGAFRHVWHGQIRARWKAGERSSAKLAHEYGVSTQTIRDIVNGKFDPSQAHADQTSFLQVE